MIIGKIGTISEDGTTVVYEANSDIMYTLRIPNLPVGTQLQEDNQGNWKVVYHDGMEKETKRRIKQQEDFYYLTRSFLPYKDYLYVIRRFPINCATKYKQNPFFLTDIFKEEKEVPICTIPQIDRNIILSTFEDRKNEMYYVLKYCLEQNELSGHTWISYKDLCKNVNILLNRTGHPLLKGTILPYLRYYHKNFYFEENAFNINESRIALHSTYQNELYIYKTIAYANSLPSLFPKYNPTYNPSLTDEQNQAIANIPVKGGHISILTGGPGVGKTTIIREIVSNLEAEYPDLNIYLLSPTGKAAKRIKETFSDQNINISTIHKFLGYGHILTYRELKLIRNADFILIDEASMLDIEIFEQLLSYIDIERTKIVLVGDVNQLPSIKAGNLLADLISIGVHTEVLTKNHRSQGSLDINGKSINNGNIELIEDENFIIDIVPKEDICDIAGNNTESDIILTAYRVETRDGSAGIINKIVQQRHFGQLLYSKFHIGDEIIIVETNYKQGYFNGETGTIISFLNKEEYLVDLGDRQVIVKNEKDIELGYAITTHKSQGSEYDYPLICIPEFNAFITRRLLYTAITRAKQKIKILVPNKKILEQIILNNKEKERRTFLGTFSNIT